MDGTSVEGIRASVFAGTDRESVDETDLGALVFRTSLLPFGSIQTHPESFLADRDAVVSDCEVVLIDRGTSALAIQINEWLDSVLYAVLVHSHGIMRGIQKEL